MLALIELKFQPHWTPSFAGDLGKFAEIASGDYRVFPTIPSTGMDHPLGAVVNDDTEFYFGSVSRSDAKAAEPGDMSAAVPAALKRRGLMLLTGPVKEPRESESFSVHQLSGESTQ